MIVRLVLLVLLGFLGYTVISAVTRWLGGSSNRSDKVDPGRMVQCSQCEVYIPQVEALCRKKGGRMYYFCDQQCLDKYRQ